MSTDPSKSRRDNRIDTDINCVVVQSLGDECKATIIDISRRGFRLRMADPPEVGDTVRLLVDGRNHRAQIAWVHDDQAGGIFLDHADPNV